MLRKIKQRIRNAFGRKRRELLRRREVIHCRFEGDLGPILNNRTTQAFFIYRMGVPAGIVQADYRGSPTGVSSNVDRPIQWSGRRSDGSNQYQGNSRLDAIRAALADHEPTVIEVEILADFIRNRCVLEEDS